MSENGHPPPATAVLESGDLAVLACYDGDSGRLMGFAFGVPS